MLHPGLQQSIPQFVKRFFAQHPSTHLIFHCLRHTENVARHAMEIARQEGCTEEEEQTLFLAAWMHDLGHLTGPKEGHEARSVEIMHEFLGEQHIDDLELAAAAEKCIMATQFPHKPESKLEEIMCDADTWHLGTPEFKDTNKQVKEELKLRGDRVLLPDWTLNSLKLLETHHFFTDYANRMLGAGKEENIDRVRKKAHKQGYSMKELEPKTSESKKQLAEETKDAKKEASMVTRGIQTMLRLTSQNHLELSNLADGKSNILISVNAIIISVILSVLVRKLETEPFLTIPTYIFLGSSVITIVIAILATRPKITQGNFAREDILTRKTNLLFFGNFYRTSLPEYEWAMGRLMKDKQYLYSSLVQDIYYLGVVLGKKYKLLRIAYNVFMVGIVVSVIAFVLAETLAPADQQVMITNGSGSPIKL